MRSGEQSRQVYKSGGIATPQDDELITAQERSLAGSDPHLLLSSPDSAIQSVTTRRRALVEMAARRQREADKDYEETGNTDLYQSLLAPFLPGQGPHQRQELLWTWDPEVERWSSEDPRTKSTLWY
jgi:hypothetical protein